MPVVNRETGKPITPEDQVAVDRRAREILSSPYSSPEQMQWAFECASGDVVEFWFWESCQEKGITKRRNESR
jgi:hypothetical protein